MDIVFPGGKTTKKTPITARIRPDLADKIKAERAAGRTKTEIIETALDDYFRDARITGQAPTVSQETLNGVRDVIREEIGEALGHLRDVIQKNGSNTHVIHEGRKAATERPTAPDPEGPTEADRETALNMDLSELLDPDDLAALEARDLGPVELEGTREALALVVWCLEVQKRYGGNIKTALNLAGPFSDKKYYSRIKLLESIGIPKKYTRK